MTTPQLVVLSSLFPSPAQPMAGVFIRERIFRVGRELPITVVAPQPWFPGQGLLRRLRPGYRPPAPAREVQQGVDVLRPRALCLPAIGRRFDALAMALAAFPVVRRLRRQGRCDIIDAHFAYPDGEAARWLGRWLDCPYTVTMRGTEPRHLREAALRPRVISALRGATRVFTVSNSLREVGIAAGVDAACFEVVGNGIDLERFKRRDRAESRRALGLDPNARVLITVGGLVERKGFHRVVELLPELLKTHPSLVYLIVGGSSPEGDMSAQLRAQVAALGLESHVRFLGPVAPEQLSTPLSAADVFVLASSNEGWANVLLEAMACGLPVVASDVGGNAEVVPTPGVGRIYPFGDSAALLLALRDALDTGWDESSIIDHAVANSWDRRIPILTESFRSIAEARTRKLNSNTPQYKQIRGTD